MQFCQEMHLIRFILNFGKRDGVSVIDFYTNVDLVSRRRTKTTCVNFDHASLDHLNDYFGRLCHDDSYVRPTDVPIEGGVEVLEVAERQLWNTPSPGPDNIPFWIWKDHTEILTPVITQVWNLSLSTHSWPGSRKRANSNSLPKVDFPKADSDYRGINVTPVIARAFEKVVYHMHGRRAVEECLSPSQFAYRRGGGGGNCMNALISIQHHVYEYLDNQDCKAVRIFTMDFSKAFDSVNHSLLSAKLKQLPLNPYIINWYHSFLHEQQQYVSSGNHVCTWQAVNKGTTQGSVSGPYLFNVFLNDLNSFPNDVPALFECADDSTVIAPGSSNSDPSDRLVELFLNWSRKNNLICNPSKCKELVVRKKNNNTQYEQVKFAISYTLSLLGVTLQSNCKFSEHLRLKLVKANRCLHVLRFLRKEQILSSRDGSFI